MRTGGCAVQQALSSDAANIVKQAVTLAKRRGHAQVTPLHVANTMLAARGGLFRVACQKSHSHPLQCKALDLCFNVALNRLPATSSGPMLGHHPQYPSISNALVAAFKRAQAHQRRGSIDNQQQPVLVVKIELDQLIISILDDPSVSRVMKEAGFSSTQVKTNIEKSVTNLDPSPPLEINENSQNERMNNKMMQKTSLYRNEDANIIIDTMVMSRKSKSLVLVGECISNLESTVKGLMEKVDKGEVPDGLSEIKFLSIPPLYSFCNLGREEVEQKIGELRCLVKSLLPKGIVLYLGDLKWISEYRVDLEQDRGYYCSVEHVIMEIGKLVCGIRESGRFWLMGIASFQTYMRCRSGNHSLESVWELQAVTIPVNSLGLTLLSQSDEHNEVADRRLENKSGDQLLLTYGEEKLTCCAECSAKFDAEARNIRTSNWNEPTLSSLPSWLRDESLRLNTSDQKYEYLMRELCKKWNTFCNSTHKQPRSLKRTPTLSSTSPSSSTSCYSSYDQQNLNFQLPYSSNPNSIPNSTSSSDVIETDYTKQKLKEFNAENLNALCSDLEKKVSCHKELLPEIAGTILQCRSGMLKRKDKHQNDIKQETWLFFLGLDLEAKEKISRELAKVVFGSYSSFVHIRQSSTFIVSDLGNKRVREQGSDCSYIERLANEALANPHRVFLVEDLEHADYLSKVGLKRAIEMGTIGSENGEEISLFDAIIVLSCDRVSDATSSKDGSHYSKKKMDYGILRREEETTSACVPLDLNISIGDQSDEDACPLVDDLGLLEIVDRCICFNVQDS